MDEVILVFPCGQTSVGKRVKKVTKAQAAAVRTLAKAPSEVREVLVRMANEWAENLRGSSFGRNVVSRPMSAPK
jgi:hypothetical protein